MQSIPILLLLWKLAIPQESGSKPPATVPPAAAPEAAKPKFESPVPAVAPAPESGSGGVRAGGGGGGEANLLGKANTEGGEAKRNENVQFNQIDNNAARELAQRMGTSATIVTEFRIDRSYFGAEFGANPAGGPHVAAISKSGAGGRVHGSVFAGNSNSALSARSFFQVGDVRPARDNSGGLNLGSALWKGGYLSADGQMQESSGYVNGNVLVPLDSERMPRTTNVQAGRLIQRFLNAYPSERPNRTDINVRALNTNSRQTIRTQNSTLQLDQKLGGKDRLSAKHTFTAQDVDAFQLVAGQNPLTTVKAHNARLGWARAVSARTNLDLTLGFDRSGTALVPEPNAVGPQVQIGTSYEKLGPGSNIPLDRVQNRFRQAAMIGSRKGNHAFSAGAEVTRAQYNTFEISSNRGNYFFRNDFGRDAITNFLEARPSRYSGAFGDAQRYHRGWEQQYFAGDTWRVNARLTLSYGVRFNPVAPPHEKSGLDAIRASCDCNNAGPRFGFAYRLPGAMGVIRSAWGLHFGDIFPTTFQQVRWNLPNFHKFEVMVPDFLNPAGQVVTGPTARSIFSSYPETIRTPYTNHYNFSWEGELPGKWRVQTGYVGARSRALFMLWHLNRARPVAGIPQTAATVQERRPDARFFDYRVVENAANAYFDAGRVTVLAPNFKGMTLDASYWFSKAIDTGASYLNTAAGDDARQGYSQTQFGVAEDLKGVSAFDQKHALLARVNYAAPRKWGGWNFNGIFLAKTGMPFTVLTGSDGPGSGNVDAVNGDRPNVLDPSILGMAINHPDIRLPRQAFGLIAPTDVRGNLGMNTFRKGGIRNLNASLSKTWTLSGEQKLSLRAESLNFFNTPQFAEPNPDLSSPAFGKITNTLNDGRVFRLQLRFLF